MSEKRINITTANLILIIALGLLLFLLWQLRSLLLILMIAIVIASTLAPIVDNAEKLNLPRWLAVILVYLSLIAFLTGLGILIGPTVIQQIERLVQKLHSYLEV